MPESEPRLIRGYLEVLAAQLPGPIVEELADGLTETHRSYLSRGLSADAAAEAAVAEFGSAQEILAGFARVNPARRTARRLLGFGPVVGGCWAAALATGRAWASRWFPASGCWRWRPWTGGTGWPFTPGSPGASGSRRWTRRSSSAC
jgi:hypothetical protein